MKTLLTASALFLAASSVHAADANETNLTESIFNEPVQVKMLNQDEMNDTKAGAIYLKHEAITGNVCACSYSWSWSYFAW